MCVCACARFLSQSHYHHPSALGSAFPLPIFPFPILMPATHNPRPVCPSHSYSFPSSLSCSLSDIDSCAVFARNILSFSPLFCPQATFSLPSSPIFYLFLQILCYFLPVSCSPTMYDNNCDWIDLSVGRLAGNRGNSSISATFNHSWF